MHALVHIVVLYYIHAFVPIKVLASLSRIRSFTNIDTKYSLFTLDTSFVFFSFWLYICMFSFVYFTFDFYLCFVGIKSQWILSWN